MNKLLLRLVMSPSALWQKLGADIGQLRAILGVKLMLDDRKPLNFGRQQSKKKARFTSALTMMLSFFTGIIYMLPLLLSSKDAILSLCLFYTLFLFFLTFTLITDFSTTLVDTRDKIILFSRPINDETIFLSRMLHIFIYLVRIVLPMSLPGWITFGIIKGWQGALWFPFPLLLMICIAVFLVNAIYLILIKFTSQTRFKEIINYFQIAFSIMFFASYYLLPRFMDEDAIKQIDILQYSWIRWLPSYWLAATWTWVEPLVTLPGTRWLSLLAIIFPLICIWITIKYLAPSFIRNVMTMEGLEVSHPRKKRKVQGKSYYQKIADLANRTHAARAGFMMTWIQTSRSRSFKMRVFPLFAYIPVYFAYLMLSSKDNFNEMWEGLRYTEKHLMLLYMSAFVLLQSLNYITMSDQYKAAWIYYAAPVEMPGRVMAGAFKAMWVKYFLPFFGCISLFVIWVWGTSALLDILLAVVNITLFAVCTMRVAYRYFPFSIAEQMNSTGARTIFRVLFTFFLIGVLGAGHYMSTFMWWLKPIFLLLSVLLLWLVWESYKGTSWQNMNGAESHT